MGKKMHKDILSYWLFTMAKYDELEKELISKIARIIL